MKLAWFRPAQPDETDPHDDTAALIAGLRASHDIDVVTSTTAHDFVWRHFREPYNLCVYELDNTDAHAFVWPYLLHYPGITLLRSLSLRESRAAALARERRLDDYRAEAVFSGDGRLLRAPLLASRMTVVAHTADAEALQADVPGACVRFAPVGVVDAATTPSSSSGGVVVAVVDGSDETVALRAFDRARAAGAPVLLRGGADADTCNADACVRGDIIIAARWPPSGTPDMAALAAMAAGKPVIVMETETTADWPAYDPQTWRPRGRTGDEPIVVSIDPRDEEHSLMVAIRDLARDAALREAIGASARRWWNAHATVERAVTAWRPLLAEATTMPPPPRPENWPRHLAADGTDAAREILADIGATVDFLR